jgi:DNA-binding NarL/FixJ family response regulator
VRKTEHDLTISLVLADDHPIVLDGLESLFGHEPDLKVLARCLNAADTLRAVREHQPDVLILDLKMPRPGGLAVLREITKEHLSTRVVLLTDTLHEEELIEAIRLGVSGVVLKEMAPRLFVECVRKVYAGERWVEKRSFGHALETLLRREAGLREITGALTPREIEIVRQVAADLPNKGIAERLFISEGTVKSHLHNIYEKLRINNRRDLTRYAQDKGLIPSSRLSWFSGMPDADPPA